MQEFPPRVIKSLAQTIESTFRALQQAAIRHVLPGLQTLVHSLTAIPGCPTGFAGQSIFNDTVAGDLDDFLKTEHGGHFSISSEPLGAALRAAGAATLKSAAFLAATERASAAFTQFILWLSQIVASFENSNFSSGGPSSSTTTALVAEFIENFIPEDPACVNNNDSVVSDGENSFLRFTPTASPHPRRAAHVDFVSDFFHAASLSVSAHGRATANGAATWAHLVAAAPCALISDVPSISLTEAVTQLSVAIQSLATNFTSVCASRYSVEATWHFAGCPSEVHAALTLGEDKNVYLVAILESGPVLGESSSGSLRMCITRWNGSFEEVPVIALPAETVVYAIRSYPPEGIFLQFRLPQSSVSIIGLLSLPWSLFDGEAIVWDDLALRQRRIPVCDTLVCFFFSLILRMVILAHAA